MRRYTSDHISKLLREQFDRDEMLSRIKAQQLIEDYWEKLPDPRLQAIDISLNISDDSKMVVNCPSSVILHYLRQQRARIEKHYEQLFQKLEISGLEIFLSEGTK